jgi:hypothetical protein
MTINNPSETASYILEHKVNQTGSRFTSGRYTRWVLSYNRLFIRVVRRLLRLSDGVSVHSDSTTSLHISTNLPNGTRLVRRVIHKVGKPGGGRKRKKPGRISRPALTKYGVAYRPSERSPRLRTGPRKRDDMLGRCYKEGNRISSGLGLFFIP